jgi:hypothetical protein
VGRGRTADVTGPDRLGDGFCQRASRREQEGGTIDAMSSTCMRSSKTIFYIVAGTIIVVALLNRFLFARDFLDFLRLTP